MKTKSAIQFLNLDSTFAIYYFYHTLASKKGQGIKMMSLSTLLHDLKTIIIVIN